jgi:hypothetical protein
MKGKYNYFTKAGITSLSSASSKSSGDFNKTSLFGKDWWLFYASVLEWKEDQKLEEGSFEDGEPFTWLPFLKSANSKIGGKASESLIYRIGTAFSNSSEAAVIDSKVLEYRNMLVDKNYDSKSFFVTPPVSPPNDLEVWNAYDDRIAEASVKSSKIALELCGFGDQIVDMLFDKVAYGKRYDIIMPTFSRLNISIKKFYASDYNMNSVIKASRLLNAASLESMEKYGDVEFNAVELEKIALETKNFGFFIKGVSLAMSTKEYVSNTSRKQMDLDEELQVIFSNLLISELSKISRLSIDDVPGTFNIKYSTDKLESGDTRALRVMGKRVLTDFVNVQINLHRANPETYKLSNYVRSRKKDLFG